VSHIVSITTEIRDAEAVRAACSRLGLPTPVEGTTRLFSGEATGLAVQLPDWKYPVVCELSNGSVQFDNYSGAWGKQGQLDGFLQAYAVEKARIEARRHGHSVTETELQDGSIRLQIQIGGAA
jgi:hypothetical protein